MKIGLVEKLLIALSVIVVLGSFAFAINAQPKPDSAVVLKTLNMTCSSCAGTIEKTLLGKHGVSEVAVDVEAARVTVVYDSRVTGPEALADAVTMAGYRSGVLQRMPIEQYRGQNPAANAQANKGGCGSACCN
jgi:copper chaperone CopZ